MGGGVGHGFQEARTEQGNYGHGHDERRQQREAEGERESGEEKLGDAVKENDGKEIDHVDQRSREDCEANFRTADFGGDHGRGSHLEMAVNVFERDDGVVDDAREGQRHTAEDHGVDGATQQGEHDEGGECRQRNRKQHGRRCAEAAEKNQNHQRSKNQPEETFVQYGVDGFLHVDRLVEDDAGLHLLREVVEMLDELSNPVHDGDRVGVAALFHDWNVDGFLAVDADDVGLNAVRILGFADIVHRDPGVSINFEWYFTQFVHVVDEAVRIDEIIVGAHLHVARGKNQIRVVHRANHIHQAELPRRQLIRIDVDHDLAISASEHAGNFRARYNCDLIANLKLGVVVKLSFVQALAFDRYQSHGQTRCVELQYDRGKSSGRKALEVGESEIG